MNTLPATTKMALLVAIVGCLIAVFLDRKVGAIVFVSGWALGAASIAIPALRAKAENWWQRGMQIGASGFLLVAVSAILQFAGNVEFASALSKAGGAITTLGIVVGLLNWGSRNDRHDA